MLTPTALLGQLQNWIYLRDAVVHDEVQLEPDDI